MLSGITDFRQSMTKNYLTLNLRYQNKSLPLSFFYQRVSRGGDYRTQETPGRTAVDEVSLSLDGFLCLCSESLTVPTKTSFGLKTKSLRHTRCWVFPVIEKWIIHECRICIKEWLNTQPGLILLYEPMQRFTDAPCSLIADVLSKYKICHISTNSCKQ